MGTSFMSRGVTIYVSLEGVGWLDSRATGARNPDPRNADFQSNDADEGGINLGRYRFSPVVPPIRRYLVWRRRRPAATESPHVSSRPEKVVGMMGAVLETLAGVWSALMCGRVGECGLWMRSGVGSRGGW